jgi:hypothetical protein
MLLSLTAVRPGYAERTLYELYLKDVARASQPVKADNPLDYPQYYYGPSGGTSTKREHRPSPPAYVPHYDTPVQVRPYYWRRWQ